MLFGAESGGIISQIYQIMMILSFLLWPILIFFGPRIYLWFTDRKLRGVLNQLDSYRTDTQQMFLQKLTGKPSKTTMNRFETLRDFKFSEPTGIDPSGLVGKLEHVLDASEHKFNRFIKANADTDNEEELADLNMAFKGVMGTHQIYKVLRHFRQLLNKTRNFQLIGIISMMLPIYEEIAEAQKEATRAFTDNAPIGDTIGPLVAAKLIQSDEEDLEEKAEDIIVSEEEISGNTAYVVKSKGPGARLGKYGNALEKLAEENELEAIITVDAGAKFEGEETGSISEGVGVMMGGPGVEKSKIEETAVEHDVPLEGIIIKQSAPEASKPMKKEIYNAYEPAREKVEQLAEEFDGEIAVVGVGNTCGVGNNRKATRGVHNKLQKYWEEYKHKDEKEVSYMGLMSAMPGGDASELENTKNRYLRTLPRL